MQRAAWLSAAVVLVVCGACASTGTPATTGPQLRVGVDLPLTGHEARAAVPALNGVRYFVKTHPRLDGFQVVLTTADDARGGFPNPNRGASNVEGFVADSTLMAMIGPFDAPGARKAVPIANLAGPRVGRPPTRKPFPARDRFISAP